MEYLMRAPVHASADEIFAAVNRSDPRASRATVYNNLRALARAGLVHEVPSDSKAQLFEAHVERHHHFLCERCGAVEDIAWFDLPGDLARGTLRGRTVREYEIVFRGLCRACKEREQKK
jgi:Fur family peroxide stress response transcriptional regulator